MKIARNSIPNKVSYHYIINYIPQSLPEECANFPNNTQLDAISPRRRLDPEFGQAKRWEPLANDLLMYWTEQYW